MKKNAVVITLLLLVNCAIAQVKHTVTKNTITFQIKNLGIQTGGTIGGLQAAIQFDPANLGASSIESTVEVNTINTDNDMRDEHLKSDAFFDVTRYPYITMKSVSIKHKSGDMYVGQFNITIKAKTQLMAVPFTYVANRNAALFKSSFKIKRSDFGVGDSSLTLSDDVTVLIVVETSK